MHVAVWLCGFVAVDRRLGLEGSAGCKREPPMHVDFIGNPMLFSPVTVLGFIIQLIPLAFAILVVHAGTVATIILRAPKLLIGTVSTEEVFAHVVISEALCRGAAEARDGAGFFSWREIL